jgi:hypothetical protein
MALRTARCLPRTENGKAYQCGTAFRHPSQVELLFPHAQTYAEGQAKRIGTRQGQKTALAAKKGALQPGSRFALWYADGSDFNLFPYLARIWKRRGKEARISTPGKNRRQPVFGAVNYATGEFIYKLWPRNNNVGFRLMLALVVDWARCHRKHVILVLDNGCVNTAKAVLTYLHDETVKKHLTVFWLPKYCPDLNDIEPLWGHVKKNGMANVLYRSFPEFQRALTQTLDSLNADNRDLLSILYARHRRKAIRINKCRTA